MGLWGQGEACEGFGTSGMSMGGSWCDGGQGTKASLQTEVFDIVIQPIVFR